MLTNNVNWKGRVHGSMKLKEMEKAKQEMKVGKADCKDGRSESLEKTNEG